jgi:hypothetical protein
MRRHRVCLTSAVALVVALGCGEPTANDPLEPSSRTQGITPQCQLGCVEPDPYANFPGYFLGSGVHPIACRNGSQTDADLDGFSDFCEKNLANAFAPELYYYKYDDVRREPRWAAKYVVGGVIGDRVRIVYLLSYYRDLGSHTFACSVPFAHYLCLPHNGDSEFIALEVYYHAESQHWILAKGIYSQHTGAQTFDKGLKVYPAALYYPSRLGGYPRAYVAEGKHANYRNSSDCNNGGTFDTDTCTRVNTAARVFAGATANIGSRTRPFIDCVRSQNTAYEYYGSTKDECYWKVQRFRGWVPFGIGGGDADAYSTRLANLEF